MEQAKEKDSRIPLLPVTTAVAAGGCIGAAVCKVTGSNLLSRIAAVIRNTLRN